MEERNPPLQPTHLLPKAGKTYRARGDIYILKASAQQTGGAFSLWEGWNEPGSGVPPHIQYLEEEAFFILEGTYTSASITVNSSSLQKKHRCASLRAYSGLSSSPVRTT